MKSGRIEYGGGIGLYYSGFNSELESCSPGTENFEFVNIFTEINQSLSIINKVIIFNIYIFLTCVLTKHKIMDLGIISPVFRELGNFVTTNTVPGLKAGREREPYLGILKNLI